MYVLHIYEQTFSNGGGDGFVAWKTKNHTHEHKLAKNIYEMIATMN
jgi:hypothetical protein